MWLPWMISVFDADEPDYGDLYVEMFSSGPWNGFFSSTYDRYYVCKKDELTETTSTSSTTNGNEIFDCPGEGKL